MSPLAVKIDCRLFTESGRISWRAPTIYLLPFAVLPSLLYAVSDTPKSALLTDILAVSFSLNAISWVQLDSFLAGGVVLGGLFFYDIWWVFGTEVVSVSSRTHTLSELVTLAYIWVYKDGQSGNKN